MATVQEFAEQAELSLAAYGNFQSPGNIAPQVLIDAGLSGTQADRFASKYAIAVGGICNVPEIGLYAVVFLEKTTNQRFLAIRGTDDAYDFETDAIDIALLGTTANQAQYAALHAQVETWMQNSTVPSPFTVTGHSLGGFLATGIAADFSSNVTHAYLYNAPGLGGIVGTILSPFEALRSALGIGATSIDPTKVSNIKAEAGISPIAGLGVQQAPVIPITIENQLLSDVPNPPRSNPSALRASGPMPRRSIYSWDCRRAS